MLIGVRQIGRPRPWLCTSLTHDSQKRWWPHGTSAWLSNLCSMCTSLCLLSLLIRESVLFLRLSIFCLLSHFPLLHFPPLHLLPHFSLLHFPLPNFQRPRQGYTLRNRQHGFTAKFVGLSYLFNLSGGHFHGQWRLTVARRKYRRCPKTIFSNQKKTKNPERLARCRSVFEMQCFRNSRLSSFRSFLHAFLFLLHFVTGSLQWRHHSTERWRHHGTCQRTRTRSVQNSVHRHDHEHGHLHGQSRVVSTATNTDTDSKTCTA